MVGCDARLGYPPDRTVRGDRRPRDPVWPAPGRRAEAAVRCRADLPGGGAGAAGCPQRAPLAADVLRPARAPVPVPAASARLPQAAQGRRAAAGRGAGPPGPAVAGLVRPGPADRRHPGAVRHIARDRQAQRAGRMGALRILRGAFALVLGAEAVLDHHSGRDARGLVPGRPQDRGTRGRRRLAGLRRPGRHPAAGPDPHRRQGLRGPGLRGPGHHRVRAASGPPRPPRRGTPARVDRLDPAVDRVGQRHPQRPARPGTPRRPRPSRTDHPRRPAHPRPDRRHLAQRPRRPASHPLPDRPRPPGSPRHGSPTGAGAGIRCNTTGPRCTRARR